MGRWTEQSSEQGTGRGGRPGDPQGAAQGAERRGQRAPGASDEAQIRRLRRAELLLQRQRAAERRRQRGFGLRLPSSKPLVFLDPPPAP